MKPERTQLTQTLYQYTGSVTVGSPKAATELAEVVASYFLNHTAERSPGGTHEIWMRQEKSKLSVKLVSSNAETLAAIADAVETSMKPERTQ